MSGRSSSKDSRRHTLRSGRGHRWIVIVRSALALLVVAGALVAVQLVRQSGPQPVDIAISIDSPSANATVSNPVQFTFNVQGARIGTPEQGLDHLHLSLDGGPEIGVYDESFSSPLPVGRHTLTADLADATHESLGVTTQHTFTVTEQSNQ